MSEKFFVGIDPGKHGALALLSYSGELLDLVNMPLRLSVRGKEEVDAEELYLWFDRPEKPISLCALEGVHGLPTDGAKSSFSFGVSVGKVKAVLEVLGVPTVEPSPQEWKSKILMGTLKDKPAAIGCALHRFPGVNLKAGGPKSQKLSHDRAEACLLALYAMEKQRGITK